MFNVVNFKTKTRQLCVLSVNNSFHCVMFSLLIKVLHSCECRHFASAKVFILVTTCNYKILYVGRYTSL
jgi:hypothetical protein